jgi:hypothetical protein
MSGPAAPNMPRVSSAAAVHPLAAQTSAQSPTKPAAGTQAANPAPTKPSPSKPGLMDRLKSMLPGAKK